MREREAIESEWAEELRHSQTAMIDAIVEHHVRRATGTIVRIVLIAFFATWLLIDLYVGRKTDWPKGVFVLGFMAATGLLGANLFALELNLSDTVRRVFERASREAKTTRGE